jgi:hypothetical protein
MTVPVHHPPRFSKFLLNAKKGLPSFFSTGSCAEYHFKPGRRFFSMYIQETTGEVKDLSDISVLFDVLQKNTHIVAQYFDIRTRYYFNLSSHLSGTELKP